MFDVVVTLLSLASNGKFSTQLTILAAAPDTNYHTHTHTHSLRHTQVAGADTCTSTHLLRRKQRQTNMCKENDENAAARRLSHTLRE